MRTQAEIFQILSQKLTKSALVSMLMDVLSLSKSGSYKVINGESELSYNQMNRILQHRDVLPILYDAGKTSNSNVVFNYPVFDRPVMDAKSYIESIYNFVKLFEGQPVELRYTSYEVPIFYYMYYPNLFAFKLFTWSKTIWQTPGFEDATFDPKDILTPEITALIEETLNRFSALPSVEYWTDQLFDNTIRQLHYFRQLEIIPSISMCKNLALDILRLIRLMRVMAASGKKFASDRSTPAAEITIYKNEIYFTNNIVSVHSPYKTVTFCAFDNPNFIITTDVGLGKRTAEWLDRMQSGCTRLTQNSDLVRMEFFRSMEYKLDMLGFPLDDK